MEELLREIGADGFAVTDDKKAEWALKKIREAEADKEMWKAYYAEQLEKIEKSADDTISYMTHLLEAYFETVPHSVTKGGQEKYKLPSGELVFTAAKLDYERDEETLLDWCRREAPEFVKTRESVDWAALKKRITETGIIPDGVTPVEKEGEFKIR